MRVPDYDDHIVVPTAQVDAARERMTAKLRDRAGEDARLRTQEIAMLNGTTVIVGTAFRPKRTTGPGTVCTVDGCDRIVMAKKLCSTHYKQALRGSQLTPIVPGRKGANQCTVDGCETWARKGPLCHLHERRRRVHGDPLAAPIYKRRKGMTDAEHAAWCLDQCDATERGCMIWRNGKTAAGYAATSCNGTSFLARTLIGRVHLPPPPPGTRLFTSCGNKLCIAPEHLRWATQSEICQLRSDLSPRSRRNIVTAEQVIEMRRRRTDGESARSLAVEYGLAVQTVYAICAGRIWQHLP